MTLRELADELRATHRRRFGRVSRRPNLLAAEEWRDELERLLGGPLPKLVWATARLAGPDFIDLELAAATYEDLHRRGQGEGAWPSGMLPVKDLQAGIDLLCVDCSSGKAGGVYVFYDNWDSSTYWPDLFAPVSESLKESLLVFLEGAEFPAGRADVEDPDGRPAP